jgi:hypothetical protein
MEMSDNLITRVRKINADKRKIYHKDHHSLRLVTSVWERWVRLKSELPFQTHDNFATILMDHWFVNIKTRSTRFIFFSDLIVSFRVLHMFPVSFELGCIPLNDYNARTMLVQIYHYMVKAVIQVHVSLLMSLCI